MTPAAVLADGMTERHLQESVRTFCRDLARAKPHQIVHYHTWSSVNSQRGFPDSVILTQRQGYAIECKGTKGKATPDQSAWLAFFGGLGFVAMVVRPADWPALRDRIAADCGVVQ